MSLIPDVSLEELGPAFLSGAQRLRQGPGAASNSLSGARSRTDVQLQILQKKCEIFSVMYARVSPPYSRYSRLETGQLHRK